MTIININIKMEIESPEYSQDKAYIEEMIRDMSDGLMASIVSLEIDYGINTSAVIVVGEF